MALTSSTRDTLLEAADRIAELEAALQQALVVIGQGVDEVLRLDPYIQHPDGTGWDPGGFLVDARHVLDPEDSPS